MKNINENFNNIIYEMVIKKIINDKDKNATFSLDRNLNIIKLSNKTMLKYGNFVYGIKEDTMKKIIENIYIFLNYGKDQKIFLGKWKDPKTNKIIIEIVKFGINKNKVINLAKYYKQYSIYDIKNNNEIVLKYGSKKQ